jgi:hypothetical protein
MQILLQELPGRLTYYLIINNLRFFDYQSTNPTIFSIG